MHQPVLYVMTHDSIGLGEDGPTHQPVEHLAACRAIPGVYVFRPGDANEVINCYIAAIKMDNHPSVMVLSRQNVPTLDRTNLGAAAGAEKGGYVLSDCYGTPQVILMGTGTEVPIIMEAAKKLSADGVKVRVVSMPCMELFEDQDPSYRESVLPKAVTARVACEAGIRLCWDKYIGLDGHFVGMSSFGASAPAPQLYEHFKITPDQVAAHAKLAIQG
jgi:transketolase